MRSSDWGFDHGLLYSRPIEIYWQGFLGNSVEMAQCGWEFFAEQDVCRDRMQIAVRNRHSKVCGVTQVEDFQFERILRGQKPPRFNIPFAVGLQVHMQYQDGLIPPQFRQVEAIPTIRPAKITKLEDLFHFPEKKVEVIQVEADPSVDELLQQIIEKQANAKRDYFEEKVRSGKLVQASSAEIIQFSAKAA